ncbi:MAG: hypothetical protein B7Z80_05835 [Rhodospirillales bacterium 20-64-7]|nr:MAG: hypothetical protein B7Z80_05835 [Rhodospirillales bacterium 20-64-7]
MAAGFLATLAIGTPACAQAPQYHKIATIALPGPAKWDYLDFDPATHRVYVSHGTEVTVVDVQSDKVIGELQGTTGSHGIAIDPATGDVWADSAAKRQAIAFDPKRFQPVAHVPVVLDADGMAYDPASRQIFVVGGDGQAVTPIDPASATAKPDIALGGSPEFLGVDGKGALFVNIESTSELVKIDTATDKIVARWPLAPCESPKGMAVDAADELVFSSCANGKMAVVNGDTGAIVASPSIDTGTDAARYDAKTHLAFSSNSVGTLSVIGQQDGEWRRLETVKTERGARTLALNPANGDIYLVTAKVTGTTPPKTPGGHPWYQYAPGSLKLLVYAPAK